MPIICVCADGHRFQVDDAYAGRQAQCPLCREYVLVPRPRRHEHRDVPTEPVPGPPQPDSGYRQSPAVEPRRSRMHDEPHEPVRRARAQRKERRKQTCEDDDAAREDEELRKRKRRRRVRASRGGQQLLEIGLILLVIAICGEVGGLFLASFGRLISSDGTVVTGEWIRQAFTGLRVVSTLLVCFSSVNAPVRGFGVAASVLGLSYLITYLLILLGALTVSPLAAAWFFLIYTLSWAAQMAFFRQMALYFKNEELASEGIQLLVFSVGSDLVALVYLLMVYMMLVNRVGLFLCMLIPIGVMLIVAKVYLSVKVIIYILNLREAAW